MLKGTFAMKAVAALVAALGMAGAAQAGFVNGSFESPLGGGAELTSDWTTRNFVITSQTNVPGWLTTASTGNIEIWRQPGPDATATPALYQDVSGIGAGLQVGWKLAHRGRSGSDTMRLTITDLGGDNLFGTGDDQMLYTQTFTDANDRWYAYSGNGIFAVGNTIRFEFGAVSTASGNNTVGNLLDAVDFGTHMGRIPEPGSLLLIGAALAAAGAASRRRKA
jgi:PEP-CTERM motif